ncbi:MAG TPA: tRNA (adenosine(37)-N6)-dimethylallyltransferase MiaA [Porphyromonadaceae bacterium]|nr:tRNA (adenosine(37)-N6)-dimethylallyltransferase MiaA [Porphyromonadaceae bacterium]
MLITVLGPTASGKTSFATQLAYRVGGEIISGDSRQVYRGMDIGTGKDLSDYTIESVEIPYHLIDIRDAGDKYTLYHYQHDFHRVYADIVARGKTPVLCGGTGLYIESVLKGYHLPDVPANTALRHSLEGKSLPELAGILRGYKTLHNTTDIDTEKRAIRAIEIADFQARQVVGVCDFPALESVIFGIHIDREERRARITSRLRSRLEEGMVQEVERLLAGGLTAEDLLYYGLEYKYLTLYVIGRLSYGEMFSQLETAIHQFAKRQMTWFRGMERRGFTIHWIEASLPMSQKLEKAFSYLDGLKDS